MTGHCNGGCQVGWTGAMCEKGYHLTINITHHEHVYIFETLYMSTFDCYLLYYKLIDNNLLCLPKKMIKIMLTAE